MISERFMMESFKVVFSLIGVLFVSIVGLYAWTFKIWCDINTKMANIYEKVNGHFQTASIHTPSNSFVNVDVCNTRFDSLCNSLKEQKEDLREQKSDIKEIKGDIKQLIKRK